MKVRPAALLFENEKLLTMRYEYSGKSLFNLPGGNLEFGEQIKDALIRELEEELGIAVMLSDEPVMIAEVHNEKGDTLHVLYEAWLVRGEPVIKPEETTALEIRWLSYEDLESVNMYPAVEKYIAEYKAGKLEKKFLGVIEQIWL
jgi:8-oxo-dGTP diphosphatase